MKTIPIHEAKANLSKYIVAAKKGTPVYIGGFGKAEVVLQALPKKKHKPLWGAMKGQLWLDKKAWDQASSQVDNDFVESLNQDLL